MRGLAIFLFSAGLFAQSGAPCPVAGKWTIYPVDPKNGGDLLQCTAANGKLTWQPVNASALPLPASALPANGAITINDFRYVVGGNYKLDWFPKPPAKNPTKK